ncbi:hypothetical protein, partial [Flammeovirga sp. OC4]|uniref:hypothetical protein n=1 Tax=Flammeovirga sp. OC4 TaxID=1382345 RepID=UPI0005C4623B
MNLSLDDIHVSDEQIYVSWKFLIEVVKIKKETVQKSVYRSRKKSNPKNWINRQDPDDRRRNLVLLKSIPSRYNPPNEQLVWDALHRKQRKDE